MTKIPDEWVEELRKTVDIVDVISEYVQLRRTGRSFVGLCPFHNEKSPSFSVSTERQMYHCFGCGAGGTVIRFVMDIDGLSFVEAAVRLAERAGMSLPIEVTQADRPAEETNREQAFLQAHELATKYYNYILMNSSVGVQALTYLETRGISRQTMVDFQLGFAPDTGRALVSFLLKRGFTPDVLVDSGLAVAFQSQLVDRFRNRVMIPIQDAKNRTVSFGGRALAKDAKPKYLNSPETELFHKSTVLFNLSRARREMRQSQTAVLFEGYMDVISAWQAGLKNGVATMGTSLTPDHVRWLSRHVHRVILAYDGDAAGLKATGRALELMNGTTLDVRIAVFLDGDDPDDDIRKRGAPAFLRTVFQENVTQLEFRLRELRRASHVGSLAGRTEFVRKALQLLSEHASPIEQDVQLRSLSSEFQLSMDALKEELRLMTKQQHQRPSKSAVERTDTPWQTPTTLPPKHISAGNTVLQAMMVHPPARLWVMEHELDELATPEQTALLALLYHFSATHPDGSAAAFVDTLEDPQLARVASSLLMQDVPEFLPEVLDDCLRVIELHRLEQEWQATMRQLVQAQIDGSSDVSALKEELDRLQAVMELRKTTPWRTLTSQG